jgi:superoxide dismutase, Cu-Zn family
VRGQGTDRSFAFAARSGRRRWAIGAIAALATVVAGGATVPTAAGAAEGDAGVPTSARAVLRDASGVGLGEITLVQQGTRVRVEVAAHGLTPGFHGLHVHTTGACVAPFTTAGPHLGAPTTVVPNNAGDLPPLLVAADGRARASFEVERFSVDGLFDADGASVIVHAGADNFANIPARYAVTIDATTLATGDAGARVLCGVVERGGSAFATGYWLADGRGAVYAFGTAAFHGSLGDRPLAEPIVGLGATPGGAGYWLAGRDGGVFAFGDAPFLGGLGGTALNSPIVGMAVPPADARTVLRDASGAAVGEVRFAQEDGRVRVTATASGLTPGFHGFHVHTTGTCTAPFTSAGGHLGPAGTTVPNYAGDMVSLYADATGAARASFTSDRYTVASLFDTDGAAVIVHAGADNFANIPARYGVTIDATTLATGDAGARVACGVVGPVGGSTTAGYWLVAADGGVFAFGDAPFLGGLGGTRLNSPIVGMASSPSGAGYWLVAADGGVFAFGDAPFSGTGPDQAVGLAPTASGAGYHVVGADGGVFSRGDAVFAGSSGGSVPSLFCVIVA